MNLATNNSMTFYAFEKDWWGGSVCDDDCAVNGPLFVADIDADLPGLSSIERKNGNQQWAKDGKPMYFWIVDMETGDTDDDGVGGIWHIARL